MFSLIFLLILNIFCKAQLNIFIETARYNFVVVIIIIIIIIIITSGTGKSKL